MLQLAKAAGQRWRLTAFLYAICAMYLLFQGGKTAFMLFCILNVLIVYLILGKWSGIARVTGTRQIAGGNGPDNTLVAGMRLEVRVHIKVPGFWPIPYVLIRDRLQRHGKPAMPFEMSVVPDFRRSGIVTYSTAPLQRGYYRFERTECSTRDIFGLFEHTGGFESPEPFRVLPQTVPIRQWNQLRRGMKGPYSHAVSSRSVKETTQLNGVREYLYGDRLSRIHWNATAKTGEWKSKEFERESIPRTVVVLDRSGRAYDSTDRFELAVSVAASIVEYGLRRETSMGLVSAGARLEGFAPRGGAEQRKLIVNHLIEAEADGEAGLYRALQGASGLLGQGSIVVVVSPQEGNEMMKTLQWLDKRGMTPFLIHLAGDERTGSRSEWQSAIRAKGWPVVSVRQLQELPAALEGGGFR